MKSFLRWLANVPIDDPVDRRNAPFLQVLFMFLGTFIPINKAIYLYAVFSGQWTRAVPGNWQLALDLITDVLIVAAAWTAVFWIRRGRFRPAVTLFISVALLSVGLVYANVGLMNLNFDPVPLLVLSIAGLVMGRRAMWIAMAASTGIILLCLVLDFVRAAHAGDSAPVTSIGKAISMIGIWLVITMVLDRTVGALRNSLAESNTRGEELEVAYRRLQEESAERERTRDQLIHAQKMEAVGRLAGGIAHDFNNVLNVILNFSTKRDQLAIRGSSALLSGLENVELAARRALAINRKLLNFSRQEINQPTVFDAGTALRELEPMLKQLLGDLIDLQVTIGSMPLPVRLDHGRFELLVLNIAANSRDAITDMGWFHVDARQDNSAEWLILRLSDNGPGMPDSVRTHAFEPFFTTKPIDIGTGLGLSVVRDMVVEAGGRIGIEDTLAGGTTIRIQLPLVV